MPKYIKRLCFFICAVISFFLFKINYDYFVAEQTLYQVENNNIKTPQSVNNKNAFYVAKSQQINYQINLAKGNHSVWGSERKRYFSQAEKALKEYMSFYPADGKYWLELLSVQYMVYGHDESLNWAIAQNLKWNRWNNNYMLNIAFYCVHNWQLLPIELQSECVIGINKLSSNNYHKSILVGAVGNIENWPLVLDRLDNYRLDN